MLKPRVAVLLGLIAVGAAAGVVSGVALSQAGGGEPPLAASDQAAKAACTGRLLRDTGDTLVGAFDSTAGDVAAWQETPQGPDGPRMETSPFRAYSPSDFVAVCYFDGDFTGLPGEPEAPDYRRVLILVPANGDPFPWVAGPDTMPVVAPPRSQ